MILLFGLYSLALYNFSNLLGKELLREPVETYGVARGADHDGNNVFSSFLIENNGPNIIRIIGQTSDTDARMRAIGMLKTSTETAWLLTVRGLYSSDSEANGTTGTLEVHYMKLQNLVQRCMKLNEPLAVEKSKD